MFILNLTDLVRFICLHLLTAPPNYKWQELLERNFPARPPEGIGSSIPLQDRDVEKNSTDGRDSDEDDPSSWRARGALTQRGTLSLRNLFTKWFIDCITVGAMMNTSAFLIIMGLLKGQSWEKITNNLRHETFTIILNGYKLWPLASIISFSFIPVERRIVFFSCVGLCWNVYMTLVAARL